MSLVFWVKYDDVDDDDDDDDDGFIRFVVLCQGLSLTKASGKQFFLNGDHNHNVATIKHVKNYSTNSLKTIYSKLSNYI